MLLRTVGALLLSTCHAYVLPGLRPLHSGVQRSAPISLSEDDSSGSPQQRAVDGIVGKIADIFKADSIGGESVKGITAKLMNVPTAQASHILFSNEEHGDGGEQMAASVIKLIEEGQVPLPTERGTTMPMRSHTPRFGTLLHSLPLRRRQRSSPAARAATQAATSASSGVETWCQSSMRSYSTTT